MADNRIVFTATLGELAEVPGSPFAYWAPKSLRELFTRFPPLDRDVARMPDKPKIADVKVGLQTSDDLRFTRYWWEVPVDSIATSREETFGGKKWVPFAKGGRPFFHDIQLVVNWERGGEELKNFDRAVIRNEFFYFREGLAWASTVSYERFEIYPLHGGQIFGHRTHTLFHPDRWEFLAFMTSSLVATLFRLLDPLVHVREIGYVAKLPVNQALFKSKHLPPLARETHDLLREWATGDETSTVFIQPWLLQLWDAARGRWSEDAATPRTGHPLSGDFRWSEGGKELHFPWRIALGLEGPPDLEADGLLALAGACVEWERRLRTRIEEIQRRIDEEVYRIYGISEEDRALIEAELAAAPAEEEPEAEEPEDRAEQESEEEERAEGLLSPQEHVRRLLHFFAHQVLRDDPDGIVPLWGQHTADGRFEPGLAERVRQRLQEALQGVPRLEEGVERALGMSLEQWFAAEFFDYHVSLYRRRPVIWLIASRPRRGAAAAFGCFVLWSKLDDDTLPKVLRIYLLPHLEAAEREVEERRRELRALGDEAPARERKRVERMFEGARERRRELEELRERLERMLRPHEVRVSSRSAWVVERVREIARGGYRPERDYGVRVNIEPLKQAGVLARAAERVRD